MEFPEHHYAKFKIEPYLTLPQQKNSAFLMWRCLEWGKTFDSATYKYIYIYIYIQIAFEGDIKFLWNPHLPIRILFLIKMRN